MAEGFAKDDPFHALEGKDGFHVVKIESGSVLMLSCMAYGGGVPCNLVSADPNDASVEIFEVQDPTPAKHGAVIRLHLALDAVARYFTTGGSWMELDNALRKMEDVVKGGLRFPGYHLTTSYSTTEGTYQHVFTKDDGTGAAVLWEEPEVGDSGLPIGGWIEPTTLDALREQQENDDTAWGQRLVEAVEAEERDPAAQGGEADLLQLPPGPGVQDPGRPEDGRGGGVPGQDPDGD